jgi:hypothetical protein
MTELSLSWLTHMNACADGVAFAKRNKLIGFPLELLPEVEGDYQCFIGWVKLHQHDTITLDSMGLLINKQVRSNNRHFLYYYDSLNNMISSRCKNTGAENKYKYDKHNNVIEYWHGCGDMTSRNEKYLYDDKNNLINKINYYTNTETSETFYTYDENNNLTHQYSTSRNNPELTEDHFWFEYDELNNIIHIQSKRNYDSVKASVWYVYDDHSNIVSTKNNWGHISNNVLEYYPDGQLKRYDSLFIPYFEKS